MKELSKRKLSRYFEYNWIFLIVVFLLFYCLFYYSLNKINEYKDEEKINIFVEGERLIDEKFAQDLKEQDPRILEYNFYLYSPEDPKLFDFYEAFGTNADILILREQDLIDVSSLIKDNFLEIDSQMKEQIVSDEMIVEYYNYQTESYGIKIYDHENPLFNNQYHFDQWIEFNPIDNFYMVFNKNSLKFGKTDDLNDMALQTAKFILERYAHD